MPPAQARRVWREALPLGKTVCSHPAPLGAPATWGHLGSAARRLVTPVRPRQRPTAKELLKHKFITRYTKKTSFLTELIDRYKRWRSEGHGEESSSEDSDM